MYSDVFCRNDAVGLREQPQRTYRHLRPMREDLMLPVMGGLLGPPTRSHICHILPKCRAGHRGQKPAPLLRPQSRSHRTGTVIHRSRNALSGDAWIAPWGESTTGHSTDEILLFMELLVLPTNSTGRFHEPEPVAYDGTYRFFCVGSQSRFECLAFTRLIGCVLHLRKGVASGELEVGAGRQKGFADEQVQGVHRRSPRW